MLLSTSVAVLSGCTTAYKLPIREGEVPSQVFVASKEDVWQAAHVALLKYRLRVDNVEAGVIETESMTEPPGYSPPMKLNSSAPGRKYFLELRFVQGVYRGRASFRVSVLKKIEENLNIIDGSRVVPSDGWEEQALLYRIERELNVFRGLKKLQRKMELEQRKRVRDAGEVS